jgi:predicted RNA-binding Zn-ribbon protein involved in translation (DUF1610 family)
MNRTVKIVIAVVVLAGAVILYFARSEEDASAVGAEYNTVLGCMECGEQARAALQSSQEFPMVCEKCGKKAAWRCKQCRSCGEIFLPPLEGDPPRQPIVATCPKCRSQMTGAVRMDSEGKD